MQKDDGSRNALRWITEGCENCERDRILLEMFDALSLAGKFSHQRILLELVWEFDKSPLKKRLALKTIDEE